MFNRGRGSVDKLVKFLKIGEKEQDLEAAGYSRLASVIGAGGSVIGGAAVFTAGAGLMTAGAVVAPEAPPVGGAALSAGYMLIGKAEETSTIIQYYLPELVDKSIEGIADLYAYASGFVKECISRFNQPELVAGQYDDIEAAMIKLGYESYVDSLYATLTENQRYIYAVIARDVFMEHFKIAAGKLNIGNEQVAISGTVSQDKARTSLADIEKKLIERNSDHALDKKIADEVKEQTKKLSPLVSGLAIQANRQCGGKVVPVKSDPVKDAYQFCEVLGAASQGASLVARITGNHRLAQQITTSAVGATQVVMGIAQIAKSGWAAGPVGMVFGGMNALVAAFGSDKNEAMEAFAEQLAVISSQIHALHEDMLFQFGRVFTALGVINNNIIQGFRLLHEEQSKISDNVIKLQRAVATLQDSVNAIGDKIDNLETQMRGYVLEDDRKQLQLMINSVKRKADRGLKKAKLQVEIMSAFETFNQSLIEKKLNDVPVTSKEVSQSLSMLLGSAEGNAGILLNYARHHLGLEVKQPIADPEQWQQCANLLMDVTQQASEDRQDKAVISQKDYDDFKHLQEIGKNWLSVVNQFKRQPEKLELLFTRYTERLQQLSAMVADSIQAEEAVVSKLLKPVFLGRDQLKKQLDFKFDFKRNYCYMTATEDWSSCKGFHNAARFMGYDQFSGEWATHLESRKKEMEEMLAEYVTEFVVKREQSHMNRVVKFYESGNAVNSGCSVFMASEIAPETMPLLPLPLGIGTGYVGAEFAEAELLGLGNIVHSYRFEKDEFIYNITFIDKSNDQSILMSRFKTKCVLDSHLNPAEAVWHAYMGGTYPANGSYSHLEARSLFTQNGDYYCRQYSAIPEFKTSLGLRKQLKENRQYLDALVAEDDKIKVCKLVRAKKRELRKELNDKVIRELESMDARNNCAITLLELDAAGKLLVAFLSIVFRAKFKKPAEIWGKEEILKFLKEYQNHDDYLTSQLATNIALITCLENECLAQLVELDIAFAPLDETLQKLTKFMQEYERYVRDDKVMAQEERVAENQEAALQGALQSALIIQGELLRAGHVDAAIHLADLFQRSGLNILSIAPQPHNNAMAGYARNQLFALPPANNPEQAENGDDKVKKIGFDNGN